MRGLVLPLEEYVGPSILTVNALCFIFLFGCMLKFSVEFLCVKFIERGISTVIWILEFHYLD
jgi:hypothetical protein